MRSSNIFTKFLLLTVLMTLVGSTATAQKQKSKTDLLKELAALAKTNTPADQAKSYEIGKEYVLRFGSEKDEMTAKVRKFVEDYRSDNFYRAVEAKKATEAFALGKDILAEQPENSSVLLNLAFAGFNAISAGDRSNAALTATHSDKAIALIEGGKGPENYAPFKSKDEALAWLNYFNVAARQDSDPKAAASYMWKATKYDSSIRSTVEPYYFIALYYDNTYAKLTNEKADKARIDKCLDLMLDAYARSMKIAETAKDPKLAEIKPRFEQIYKFRKGTDLLMKEFVEITLSSRMPDPASFN